MKKHLLAALLTMSFVAGVSAQSWVVSPGTSLPNDATATKYFPLRCTTNSGISYGSHNSSEVGDLYLPNPMPAHPVPAVILVHGGGGTGGSRASTRETQQGQLLAAHGYVAFNIDYTTGAVWPNNIRDWRLAVRWLRAHAATYNIDTNHIGIIGGSFGGYAAGIMSGITNGQMTLIADTKASYNNISLDVYSGEALNSYSGDVQACFDMYGPMLFTGTSPFDDANGQYSSPTASTYYNASAIHYVHPTSKPVFITQGTADSTVDITNSYIMTNALKLANVPYQFARISGAAHTFCIFDSTKGGTWPSGGTSGLIDLRKDMCDFYDQWLIVSGQSPNITAQPQAATGCIGSPVSFSVTAGGSTPLSYQWQFNGTNIVGATNISYSFVINANTNAGNYSIVVTNTLGTTTSSNAALTVNAATPPAITSQPAAATVLGGGATNFTVLATGTALQYQWSGPAGVISGATNSTLTINNAQNSDTGNYSVAVFNTCNTVVSSNASLTVNAPPSITAQPDAQTACTGTAGSFIVSAIGVGTLGYQWFNPLGGAITNATNSVVTLNNLYPTNSGNYFVVVTNAYGAVTSSVAGLTVSANSTISIATQPTNTEVLLGGTATFTVVPAGGGNYTYLWHAGDAEPIPHAVSITNATLTITNAQPSDIAPYTCLVMNDCSQVAATPASLLVDYPPVITQQPSNTTVFAGVSATLTVVADGTQPVTYQWRKAGVSVAGQTNNIFAPGVLSTNDTGSYDVIITNNYGAVTSSVATLTVLPSAAGNVLITEIYMSGGKSGATSKYDYVVLKNVTAGSISLNGWSMQHLKTNVTWFAEALPNATIPAGGYYFIQCYNDGASGTNGATLTADFTTTQASAWNLSGSTGETVALVNSTNVLTSCADAAVVDKVGFNTGAVCYLGTGIAPTSAAAQSVQRKNNGCQNTADNASDFALGTPNPHNSSSAAELCSTGCVGAGISSNPASQTVSLGNLANFSVTASGSTPFSYQWRKAGTNINTATNSSYNFTTASTNDAGNFDVVVTNACGAITSSVATLTIGAAVTMSTTNFDASGTWLCPAGVTSIQVECWGGGGGGAGTAVVATRTGAGGAGGSYVKNISIPVIPGTNYIVTVGAGGAGGGAGSSLYNAAAGGASYFRLANVTNIIAFGGAGAVGGTSLAGAVGATTGNAGYSGSFNYPGGNGGASLAASYSGGGGASACTNAPGAAGTNNSPGLGVAGGGNGGTGLTASGNNASTGAVPGGGGAGGFAPNSASGKSGSAGGSGRVIITYAVSPVTTPPAATTLAASSVTASAATLNGSVIPGSSAANVYFQYGLTTNYGNITVTNLISAGTNSVAVSNVVTGLTSGTTYHFRTIAANAVGTSTGADLTFTTLTVTQPQVKPVMTLGNNQFGFNFTNAPGAIFTVLVATNIALDVSNWSVFGTMLELPSGTYSFSNSLDLNGGHFYRIRSP